MHPNAVVVIEAGRSIGLEVVPREFAVSTRTAAEAAQAIGVQPRQIVKSLVFVWAAAGTPHVNFPVYPRRLAAAIKAVTADLAADTQV